MAWGYTEAERTYILLALERDCLRLTLASLGPVLSGIPDARPDLSREVKQAYKRLPEVERLLDELDVAASRPPGS